jgi:hypothetical protein
MEYIQRLRESYGDRMRHTMATFPADPIPMRWTFDHDDLMDIRQNDITGEISFNIYVDKLKAGPPKAGDRAEIIEGRGGGRLWRGRIRESSVTTAGHGFGRAAFHVVVEK